MAYEDGKIRRGETYVTTDGLKDGRYNAKTVSRILT